jgi:hypothetical protein
MFKTTINILVTPRMRKISDGLGDLKFQADRRIRRKIREVSVPRIKDLKETTAPTKLKGLPIIGHGAYVIAQIAVNNLAVIWEDAVN